MRTLLSVMIALSLGAPACGGKKAQPPAAPVANEATTGSADMAAPTEPAGSAAPAAGSGSGSAAATCVAEGGSCINMAAAVACGPKSHNGGCADNKYCCIR